jgi:hypothetical protein
MFIINKTKNTTVTSSTYQNKVPFFCKVGTKLVSCDVGTISSRIYFRFCMVFWYMDENSKVVLLEMKWPKTICS